MLLNSDESFVGQTKQLVGSFLPAKEPRAAWVAPGRGGERLCFMDMLGPRGLLVEMTHAAGGAYVPFAHNAGELVHGSKSAGRFFFARGAARAGDYHGNFNAEVFIKTARAQWVSAIQHHFPSEPNVLLLLDNAPYHVATTTSLTRGAERFNPHRLGRRELCELMASLGCAALVVVTHARVDKARSCETAPLRVELSPAEGGRRGKQGAVASLRELQDAALAWLVEHKPRVLMNDIEALLEERFRGRVRVAWVPPYSPEFCPIEMVWAQAKQCYGARATGARTRADMLADILEGLYTSTAPAPHVTRVHGGNFVPDAPGGRCASAEKLWRHVLHSPEGAFERFFRVDGALRGPVGRVAVAPGTFGSTENLHVRAVLRYRVAQAVQRESRRGRADEAGEAAAGPADEGEPRGGGARGDDDDE